MSGNRSKQGAGRGSSGKGPPGKGPSATGSWSRGAAARGGSARGGSAGESSDKGQASRRASGARQGTAQRTPMDVQALEAVLPLTAPADAALRRFFREHPSMGRRDRALVAETVFDVLRNRRLYAHLSASGEGSLAERFAAVSRLRRGLPVRGSGPGETLPGWLARVRTLDPASLPFAVRFSLPDWLAEALVERPGAEPLAAALLEPAPLDLRVNLLKGDRASAIAALAEEGIIAEALDVAPFALRVQGKPALERSRAFTEGLVEVQDAGSQLLALLVGARRGQTIVDFCAGAGGKTLALAAAMRSTGQVFACDVSPARLLRLRPRLHRAGATNVQPLGIDNEHDPRLERLGKRADAVLVDAPCSGTGTLRRNPDLKWRGDPTMLGRLQGQQQSILEAAAQLVKPGGVLVYATCSLLPQENERQAQAFEDAHPGFVTEPAREYLASQGASLGRGSEEDEASGFLRLAPHLEGVDGFFAARWRREG